MTRKHWTIGLTLLFGVASVGWTADGDGGKGGVNDTIYLAPLISYSDFGQDSFEPNDGFGGQLGLGKAFNEYIAMELYAYHFESVDLEGVGTGDSNMDTTGYGLSALFFPARDILPVFGLVGIGAGEHDFNNTVSPAGIDQQDAESQFVDFGLGFIAPLTEYGIALRGEYRYRLSDVDRPAGGEFKFRDNVVSLGLQIPLGAKRESRQPMMAPEPAAAPAPPPSPPPPPPDGDRDGVPDAGDRCPDTALGTEVDEVGCAIEREEPVEEEPIVLHGVNFETDSATLTAMAKRHLDEVAAMLRDRRDTVVRVEGHTDSIGAAAYNLDLSQRRAESVKTYLVRQGVDAKRLQARGYGESRPVASNTRPDGSDNPGGRAQNRRVELHIAGE